MKTTESDGRTTEAIHATLSICASLMAHSLQAFFSENSTKIGSGSSANSSLPASALKEGCWGSPEPPSRNGYMMVETRIILEKVTKPSLLSTPIKNQAPPLSFSYTASEREQNQQQVRLI